MQESGTEQLAKIDALESNVRKLLDDNRGLEHRLRGVRFEKECHEAREVERKKEVTDAKAWLANAKEALRVLQGWYSADRWAMNAFMEDRTRVQGELGTT